MSRVFLLLLSNDSNILYSVSMCAVCDTVLLSERFVSGILSICAASQAVFQFATTVLFIEYFWVFVLFLCNSQLHSSIERAAFT